MARTLNLHDIQGNVIRAYGRYSFPYARYFFLHIDKAAEGRKFVDALRKVVTTGARWPEEAEKPACTVNVAFSFMGLLALEVPTRTLKGMPFEFADGMKARAFVLGDRDTTKVAQDDPEWDAHWDPIWQKNRAPGSGGAEDVHVWISLNAQLAQPGKADPSPALETRTQWLRDLCEASGGSVRILNAGRDDRADYLEANAVFDTHGDVVLPTPKEHFGFADGIGDPVFDGQYRPEDMPDRVIGRGKRMDGKWTPIATGEFILGHPDESQELPPAAMPPEFSHNGTFMAFRKLHENVGSFNEVLEEESARFAKVMSVPKEEARETLMAKMCGRWSDGVPLAKHPTFAGWQAFKAGRGFDDPDPVKALENQMAFLRSPCASDFRYADDMPGYKVPGGAHIRRMNTRGYLDPLNQDGVDAEGMPYPNKNATHALNKRRRVLRRGLPYGSSDASKNTDETEQGVAMILMGASLFRQFEFVQQQWVQYGLDFNQGNNTCPMLGDHSTHKRHTIPADPKCGKPPYIMSKLKTFVECRGGEYFFVPSMTALRLIAMGVVDPT
ncbi:peroxidase [Shimia sp. R9_2]|uniref:Dyp-type peroxidase n=1 Tax=Shimia sp. R9_2 TaxID=2821112 RepID=UPI001ADC812B|nr:peroxidase [Shimia sp. R9_2]MBO9397646.1 peroxidase [Shimia sp. R9_2]